MEPDEQIAIAVDNVGKIFKLPHEKTTSIKSLVLSFRKRRTYEKQQALKDITFEVRKGEFFGIVGRNGSGKSTLLKLLAGIYTPTKGAVSVNGTLTPFIELGVGFNPELTGRENVFLNGALLGFSRREMQTMYQSIVDFAELERFMDQKLKNYSSGMQVRLAFSIAIRARSDILLIDEVLAVGDAAFQQKCYDIFEKLKAEKKTIVFVSHDMSVVRRFCDRAVLIEKGDIIDRGSATKIAQVYSELNEETIARETLAQNIKKGKQSEIQITLRGEHGKELPSFHYGDKLDIVVEWPASIGAKNVGVAIYKQSGEYIFGANTKLDKFTVKNNKLHYSVTANFGAGRYLVVAGILGEKKGQMLDLNSDGPTFKMLTHNKQTWEGLVYLDHGWSDDV